MAKDKAAKPKKMSDRDFLDLAMKRFKKAKDADSHNRKEALDDLRFTVTNDQWDNVTKKQRSVDGRPTLTINLLNPFIKRLVGDQRQTRPKVKVIATDVDADSSIASIRQGLVWNTEYQSNADAIYDYAYEGIVRHGYGAWRILNQYSEENPFVQDIVMERIKNPLAVYMDPNAKDFMYSDAEYGFIVTKIPRKDLEDEYPDKDFDGTAFKGMDAPGLGFENWFEEDLIVVAEYFVREKVPTNICRMEDGRLLSEAEAKDAIKAFEDQKAQVLKANPALELSMPQELMQGPKIAQTKESYTYKVKQYRITATEILNEHGQAGEPVPGEFIPIVLVRGEESNIEGKTYIRSLIRYAKDIQRLFNYWESAKAERIALAPKSPWLMTAEQVEGYEDDFQQANTRNFPYLKYNHIDGQPMPQRVDAGSIPQDLFIQSESTRQTIRDVLGMHSADMGDVGREQSGVAIQARQLPGDISAFVFLDNLARAIKHSGRIINEMIPEVYDSERDVRIRNIDNSEQIVPINTNIDKAATSVMGNPQRYQGFDLARLNKMRIEDASAKFNDLSQGKYAVHVDLGPSFSTQRQQTVETMLSLIQSLPQIGQIAPDLICKNLDIAGADELEQRMRKTLPPGLATPKEGDQQRQQMPPSPQAMAMQADVQSKLLKAEAAKINAETAKLKAMNELGSTKEEIRKEVLVMLRELLSEDTNNNQQQQQQLM